jgi:hypothetical protein
MAGVSRAKLDDRAAFERELRRMAAGDRRRYEYFRREVARSVRKGEAVVDPSAAPLAIAAARLAQKAPVWPWTVVVPVVVLAALALAIGGFALVWFVATVVPAVATEPLRARRRRNRALSAEAANLALV